jgi:hypothetical protein
MPFPTNSCQSIHQISQSYTDIGIYRLLVSRSLLFGISKNGWRIIREKKGVGAVAW